MSDNPGTNSGPRPYSSGSLKDDGSQTPTPGSPTQALTPRTSTTTQRIIPPRENDESKDSHEGTEGAEGTEQLDPAAEIEHFDWAKLEERYHRAISERNKEEQEILQEWENLMNVLCSHTNSEARTTINKLLSQFFTIWAQTTQTHEVERSFKRYRPPNLTPIKDVRTKMSVVVYGLVQRTSEIQRITSRRRELTVCITSIPYAATVTFGADNKFLSTANPASDTKVISAFESALALLNQH